MTGDSRSPAAGEGAGAPDTGGVARLAASQLRRVRRIVDAAVALAEKGGFEGVRLRDVAEASGVALGTLYKYFCSKEDILLFAVNEEAERLENVIAARPPSGGSAQERTTEFFARATRGFTRRPNFARAVIRAIASGDHKTAAKVAGFHLRMARMIIAAIRDESLDISKAITEPEGSEQEQAIVMILEHVWFSALVGWGGGLHPVKTVTGQMRTAAANLLGGSSHPQKP
jgi:AcrR family transcriptional regulator